MIMIFFWPACLCAEYTSTDLFTIPWGSGENELFILPAEITDSGVLAISEGPRIAFVDQLGNVVFSSFQTYQLKGFSNSGELIFDFSTDGADFNPEMYDETPENIYVDSLMRLYIQSDPGTKYVPVIEYSGEIVEKIRPFRQNPNATINYMSWSPDGVLFFFNREYGWVTYSDGESRAGGSTGFLASNGSFYSVTRKTANSLQFKKFENPDSTTLAETRESTEVPVDVDTLVAAGLINGGDGNSIYVILAINSYFNFEIWQFDLDYNNIDKLSLTSEKPYEGIAINPFIRDDGNIYEFLAREDGLHVIRWSKE